MARKPDYLKSLRRRMETSFLRHAHAGAGAGKKELRDALLNRFDRGERAVFDHWAASVGAPASPRSLSADQLFDALYCLAWCRAWSRHPSEYAAITADTSQQLELLAA